MTLRWPTEWIGSPTRVILMGLGTLVAVMGWMSFTDVLPESADLRTPLSPVIIAVCTVAFVVYPRFTDRAMAVIAVCFIAALVDPVLYEPFISAPAVLYATYLAAAHSKRRLMPFWLTSLLAGVMVGIAKMLYNTQSQLEAPATGGALTLGILVMSVVAWIVVGFFWRMGLDTRNRRQAMATLEQRAELAAVTERNRIAREMHDIVAHSLSGIMALADGARFAAAEDPALATETLGTISDESRRALTQMRGLLSVLRDDYVRETTSTPGTDDIGALVKEARARGLELGVAGFEELPELPELTQFTIYRVCQEMLTNMLRHASEPRGTLAFSVGASVRITATNPAAQPPGEGFGLIGMRERVLAHEGRMDTNFDGDSFTVTVEVPA